MLILEHNFLMELNFGFWMGMKIQHKSYVFNKYKNIFKIYIIFTLKFLIH